MLTGAGTGGGVGDCGDGSGDGDGGGEGDGGDGGGDGDRGAGDWSSKESCFVGVGDLDVFKIDLGLPPLAESGSSTLSTNRTVFGVTFGVCCPTFRVEAAFFGTGEKHRFIFFSGVGESGKDSW